MALAEVYDESIADSGSTRYFLRVGGEFGLLRWEAADPASISLQLDLIAGMDGQFDIDRGSTTSAGTAITGCRRARA